MTSPTDQRTASIIPDSISRPDAGTHRWATPRFHKLATSTAQAAEGPSIDASELTS